MTDETTDAPVQDGSDEATRDEKLRGLVAQVQADVDGSAIDSASSELRRRLHDAAIVVSDEEFAALVEAVHSD
ncbi:MAG: hypothetical protein ABWX82_10710 [Leifsonia sp.]